MVFGTLLKFVEELVSEDAGKVLAVMAGKLGQFIVNEMRGTYEIGRDYECDAAEGKNKESE